MNKSKNCIYKLHGCALLLLLGIVNLENTLFCLLLEMLTETILIIFLSVISQYFIALLSIAAGKIRSFPQEQRNDKHCIYLYTYIHIYIYIYIYLSLRIAASRGQVLSPRLGSVTVGHSRLWNMVVVLAHQPMEPGRYDNLMLESTISPSQ